MTICIVDTSIVVELLDVPGRASRHEEVVEAFAGRVERKEQFLLPIAVVFETGNHIAQVSDGRLRRQRATTFVTFVRDAINGTSPFAATPFPENADVAAWLDDFPDNAGKGIGLADRSLIALWELQRVLNPSRRVYIWALDAHLMGYDAPAS